MDVASIVNLGIGGFAILVMWWMYDSNTKERNRHDEAATNERSHYIAQMTEREVAFRQLEEKVRDKVMTQLNENTKAFQRVLDHFSKTS